MRARPVAPARRRRDRPGRGGHPPRSASRGPPRRRRRACRQRGSRGSEQREHGRRDACHGRAQGPAIGSTSPPCLEPRKAIVTCRFSRGPAGRRAQAARRAATGDRGPQARADEAEEEAQALIALDATRRVMQKCDGFVLKLTQEVERAGGRPARIASRSPGGSARARVRRLAPMRGCRRGRRASPASRRRAPRSR